MTVMKLAYDTSSLRIKPSAVFIVLAVFSIFLIEYQSATLAWANEYPRSWVIPFSKHLSETIKWLLNDADLGLFTFKEFTRSIGALLDAPTLFLKKLLVTGFKIDGDSGTVLQIPPLSWLGVTIGFVLLGASLGDRRLTGFVLLSFLYVALIGLWDSTMLTFASIIVAVSIGIAAGMLLGIAAFKWVLMDRILTPVFDFMQTMPVFAYLVPALMMFGYGPAAAMVVTLIYAMPPMARVTKIALTQVSSETVEFGRMAGCSSKQLTWKVMIPSIRPRLMVGVNQVIMLTLNMVIIASLIGAGGLGFDVWQALKALRIGQGAEAGIAITLVAIVLDRLSQRYAARRPVHRDSAPSFFERYRLLITIAVIAIGTTAIGHWVPAVAQIPDSWTFSTGKFWDNIIDWININLYEYIDGFRRLFFIYLLKPTKSFMLSLPWLGTVLVISAIGYHLGRLRLAILCAVLVSFIAVVGLWEKAIKERGGDTSNLPRSLLHHLHVCEEGEDAEARYEQILEAEGWYLGHRAGVNSVELAEGESEHLKRNWSYKLDMREIIEGGGVIGQAEKVIDDVRRLRDEYGVNNIMVGPWRGPDSKDVVRSLELFAREVMPALQD